MSNKTIIMCDDDSEVRATYAYTWAWGERGHCSEAGRQRREQLAQTLQRHVAFVPLGDSEPVPMVLEERARLAGQIYALTEENRDLRARGAEMYAELGQLRSDNRLLVVREKEARRAVDEAMTVAEQAKRGLADFERENSELLEEVGILRALVPSSPE
jgi:hypothetical protein